MKILVLGGGISNEREVSIRSAAAVSDALQQAGYETVAFDPVDGLEELANQAKQVDVVFPVLHGQGGEDGTVQRVLEDVGVPFVGSSAAVSELCFDKIRFKQLMKESGVPVPDGDLVGKEFLESANAKKPFVLKPYDGGSSIDTFIVRTSDSASQVDAAVFDRNPKMLYEELIVGTETTIAILDGKALPVIEIIPPESGEFDYDNKYNGQTQELCPPKTVSDEVQQQVSRLAEEVYKLSGARHFARVDIMLDEDNNPFVLELNTIPGMTEQSLFPKPAKVAGLEMPDLVDRLVKMAVKGT